MRYADAIFLVLLLISSNAHSQGTKIANSYSNIQTMWNNSVTESPILFKGNWGLVELYRPDGRIEPLGLSDTYSTKLSISYQKYNFRKQIFSGLVAIQDAFLHMEGDQYSPAPLKIQNLGTSYSIRFLDKQIRGGGVVEWQNNRECKYLEAYQKLVCKMDHKLVDNLGGPSTDLGIHYEIFVRQ